MLKLLEDTVNLFHQIWMIGRDVSNLLKNLDTRLAALLSCEPS